jgi:hypothetical protein
MTKLKGMFMGIKQGLNKTFLVGVKILWLSLAQLRELTTSLKLPVNMLKNKETQL